MAALIANITKGASARGGMEYDHGPGRRDEHRNPHKVAGNVPGRSWRERARMMDAHHKDNAPRMSKPIHRASINLANEDRRLTDKEWRQVAERYVEKMGFERCPWEAIRHDDGHIHMTVVRVQWDGTKVRDSHDFRRSQSTCRTIERDHGLTNAERKFNRGRPQVRNAERTRAQRQGVVPEKDLLRDRIQHAEQASDGTRASYENRLTESGVNFRANVAKTGRVSGYSYGLDGHVDAEGEAVMYKGSQLGKDYRWAETERRLEAQRTQANSNHDHDLEQRAAVHRRGEDAGARELPNDEQELAAERDEEREQAEVEREDVERGEDAGARELPNDEQELAAERDEEREQAEVEREDVKRGEDAGARELPNDEQEQQELTARERAQQRAQERAEHRAELREGREHDSDRTNDSSDSGENVRPARNDRAEQDNSERDPNLLSDRDSDDSDQQSREGNTPTERNDRMTSPADRSDDGADRADDTSDPSSRAESLAQQRQQERAERAQEREQGRDQDRSEER